MTTLRREEFVEFIKNGDDRYDNQIRVTKNGDIFLSRTVGADNIEGLRFRLETFDARNGYVGLAAATDNKYIDELYSGLQNAWKSGRTGYIDFF